VADGNLTALTDKMIYEIIRYQTVDGRALEGMIAQVPDARRTSVADAVADVRAKSTRGALAGMTVFPTIMLIAYVVLILHFKSRGGYRAVHLEHFSK